MRGEPLRVGRIEITPLLDADWPLVDTLPEQFPGVPAEAWGAIVDDQPALVGPGGTWRLHVRCTLIRTGDRLLLVDTGVGPTTAPASAWFSAPGRLIEELAAAGASPADVDTVVITHVHDDHLGGLVLDGEPAFPRARHVLQDSDLEAQRAWAVEDEEDRVIYEALLRPLEAASAIDPVSGDAEIASDVAVRLAPGHTPGHQIVEVASGGERLVITGDAFNLPVQIAEPDWHSGSDHDPALASETRRRVAAELSAGGALVAPSHFAEPFGRIGDAADGRPAWEPLGA